MKKILFVASMILLCTLSAVAQDRMITYDQLPQSSQTFITTYFSKANVQRRNREDPCERGGCFKDP